MKAQLWSAEAAAPPPPRRKPPAALPVTPETAWFALGKQTRLAAITKAGVVPEGAESSSGLLEELEAFLSKPMEERSRLLDQMMLAQAALTGKYVPGVKPLVPAEPMATFGVRLPISVKIWASTRPAEWWRAFFIKMKNEDKDYRAVEEDADLEDDE